VVVPPSRSDARDNRARILAVARDSPAKVTMREIARRARVGVATLYRHFPSREALVAAVFAEQAAACTAVVDAGLADPDPWRGFRSVVEEVTVLHALDSGATAGLLRAYPRAVDVGRARERAALSLAALVRRARESGELRPDVDVADLVLLIKANSGLRPASPAASRRFAGLMIESFRAHPATGALPPAVRLPLMGAR